LRAPGDETAKMIELATSAQIVLDALSRTTEQPSDHVRTLNHLVGDQA
jgi:hypothetical protein